MPSTDRASGDELVGPWSLKEVQYRSCHQNAHMFGVEKRAFQLCWQKFSFGMSASSTEQSGRLCFFAATCWGSGQFRTKDSSNWTRPVSGLFPAAITDQVLNVNLTSLTSRTSTDGLTSYDDQASNDDYQLHLPDDDRPTSRPNKHQRHDLRR